MELTKEELQARLQAIEEKEFSDKIETDFPELKKFEGKYFKLKDTYGSGKSWYRFISVLSVKKEDAYFIYNGKQITSTFSGISFETRPEGMSCVKTISSDYIHSLDKEISEKEFKNAFNKMMNKLWSLV